MSVHFDNYCEGCTIEVREKTFINIREQYKLIQDFQYSYNEYSRPTNAVVSLTDDCVLSCNYCFCKQQPNYMSYETAEAVVQWLLSNKQTEEKPSYVFFGGEPLMQFENIIKPLVEKYYKEINFSITTNGILLNEDVVDFLYKYQIQPLLSFDGVPEVQNKQRTAKNLANSFDQVLLNIPYLLLRFPKTVMRATLTAESIPYLYESVQMAKDLGFQNITFCPNDFETWGKAEEGELKNQFEKIALDIYSDFLHDKMPIKVLCITDVFEKLDLASNEDLRFNNAINRCGLGTTTCGIAPNGDIVPCQEKTSCASQHSIGNVLTGGIDSQKHQLFLEDYFSKVNSISCSLGCSDKQKLLCISDLCPSRLEDLSFQIGSPHCTFVRVLDKIVSRLYFLCNHSMNPLIRYYFTESEKMYVD